MYTLLLLLVTLLIQYFILRRLFIKYIYGGNFLRNLRKRISLNLERVSQSGRPLLREASSLTIVMPNSSVHLQGVVSTSPAKAWRDLDAENIIAIAGFAIQDAHNSSFFNVQAKVQRCACYRRACQFFFLNPDCKFCD